MVGTVIFFLRSGTCYNNLDLSAHSCCAACTRVRVSVSINTRMCMNIYWNLKSIWILWGVFLYGFTNTVDLCLPALHALACQCVHLHVSECARTNVCTRFHPNTQVFPRGLASWCEAWWSGCLGWEQGIFPSKLIRPSNDVIRQPWVTVVKTTGTV